MTTAEFEFLDKFVEDLSNKIKVKYGLNCRIWNLPDMENFIGLYITTDKYKSNIRIFYKKDTEMSITYWYFDWKNPKYDYADYTKKIDCPYMNLEKLEKRIYRAAKSVKDLLDNYEVLKKQKKTKLKLDSIEKDFK